MKILNQTGNPEIAMVYLAELGENKYLEFAESLQPPIPRDKKWVLLVSTLFGCPVGCRMCDAGAYYQGKLSKDEIFDQIDYLVKLRYPQGFIPVEKFKIQFSRSGEPALNMEVLKALEELPRRYPSKGLLPSLSTVAPAGSEAFFQRLLELKRDIYHDSGFQLQFSIHTTDQGLRDQLIPIKKWDFTQIADFAHEFYRPGDRKVTLNFALEEKMPLEPLVLSKYFTPEKFLIKITPINPTYRAEANRLDSYLASDQKGKAEDLHCKLIDAGYEVIISIGELEENLIGSNCGQLVLQHLKSGHKLKEGYKYWQ